MKLFLATAAAALAAAPAALAACPAGYGYAGLFSDGPAPATGVAATITAGPSRVDLGHVAAWVNVGSGDAWLQAGLNATPGSQQKLYVEVTAPGASARYVQLVDAVPAGEPHRLALVETAPDTWRVYVDGVQALPDVHLPGSRSWKASASSEAWRPVPGTCNGFGYRLAAVAVRTAGRWQTASRVLYEGVDPGFRLVRAGAGAWEATGRG